MVLTSRPFARKFKRNDPVLDKIDRELLKRYHGKFSYGGWCSQGGKHKACSGLRTENYGVLKPGPSSRRLKNLLTKLLSDKFFRKQQCRFVSITMVYCSHCAKNVAGERLDDGFLCCGSCGRVLEDYFFAEEPSFVKNAAGQSKLSGNYVRTVQSEYSESRQRTLDRAYDEIKYLSFGLGVNDEHMAEQALTFYKIALERNFTRGRKSEQVHAACLYIAFRHNNKPYLLIDFSNYLRTDVYVLGAVFLQLCQVLRLGEHPIVQKPVDPSLFIHRYTKNLLKRGSKAVSDTALAIVASMKRDWMQTGRKPSGLCGAALYISALAHGIKCSKPDILKIVHVCEATLTKRLVEFEDTESSSLTVEELNTMAKEHEKNPTIMPEGGLKGCISKDLLCEHKEDSGVTHFALGLCEACYKDFDKLSGGLGGGLDPPAFQRAERERLKKTLPEESVDEACALANASNDQFKSHKEDLPAYVPESIGANVEHEATKDGKYDDSHREDESETLSDIDDEEVDLYIHDEEGKHIKKILWETANREYLEEQAAKEAAAAANKKAFEAKFENCSEDILAARELAASSIEAVAKSRKEMRQKRAYEAKNTRPAQSAAEAFGQMSNKKRGMLMCDWLDCCWVGAWVTWPVRADGMFDQHGSAQSTVRWVNLQGLKSKVNFELLNELFDEMDTQENTDGLKIQKKVRFDSPLDKHDNLPSKIENKNEDEMGSVDEFEDEGDMGEMYQNTENMADKYFPEDDGFSYNDYNDYY
ncbi:Transcription factor IIIB 90 kDa subunit isoform C [Glycine soja]|uniref:Transcription factor IIIB 90 kDa subunit isoform C n=1 Tax=Glycine soja TaxID=3848 RepID=A0A445GDV3_GLYSO|nr:Transcription factor IIIB 90 kDa subunit isoform C [Glycine soja]